MLQSLHVKNFAIIEESEVEFREHLNILTGETGAGKSLLIGSVNAALGGKVTKDIIRQGAEYALMELTFSDLSASVEETLRAMEIYPEEHALTLTRKVMENGRNICKINGETVTVAALREAAACLIDIHGQQENLTLRRTSAHLELLDHFAAEELGELPAQMKQTYRHWKDCKEKLERESIGEEERNRETAYLTYAVEEIAAARLQPGEDEQAEEEYHALSHAKQIAEALSVCLRYVAGEESENAEEYLTQAERQLSKVAEYDGRLSGLTELLSEAENLLDEFRKQAQEYADQLEDSEERFHVVGERLDLINRLKAKYGKQISDILEYQKECEEKLRKYENYDAYLENCRKDYEQLTKEGEELGRRISKIRRKKAAELSEAVKKALLELNFSQVLFEIPLESTGQFRENGSDVCEFMISLNPGEPVKPLIKVASGGELSRVMLALKSVLAEKDEIPTLIFDEIDAGISGRTAQRVSEKLAKISATHQVICITHLAQIAAMADAHFVIEKEASEHSVVTGIRELTKEEMCGELARILGGAEITSAVYENAREMKRLAKACKEYLPDRPE